MGNVDTKLNFRKAVVQLTSKSETIDASDDSFWSENVTNVQDIFTLVPAAGEIRAFERTSRQIWRRYVTKPWMKIVKAVDSSCRTRREQQTVLNCTRLLMRVLPYTFEDSEWRGFSGRLSQPGGG